MLSNRSGFVLYSGLNFSNRSLNSCLLKERIPLMM